MAAGEAQSLERRGLRIHLLLVSVPRFGEIHVEEPQSDKAKRAGDKAENCPEESAAPLGFRPSRANGSAKGRESQDGYGGSKFRDGCYCFHNASIKAEVVLRQWVRAVDKGMNRVAR